MGVARKYQKTIVGLDGDRKFALSRSQEEAILSAEPAVIGDNLIVGWAHRRSVKSLHKIGLVDRPAAPAVLTHEGVLVRVELGGSSSLPDEGFAAERLSLHDMSSGRFDEAVDRWIDERGVSGRVKEVVREEGYDAQKVSDEIIDFIFANTILWLVDGAHAMVWERSTCPDLKGEGPVVALHLAGGYVIVECGSLKTLVEQGEDVLLDTTSDGSYGDSFGAETAAKLREIADKIDPLKPEDR